MLSDSVAHQFRFCERSRLGEATILNHESKNLETEASAMIRLLTRLGHAIEAMTVQAEIWPK